MIDASGKNILPYKYSTIEDAGNGLFVAREWVQGQNQAGGPDIYHLFDAHGNEFPLDEKLLYKLNLDFSPPSNLPKGLKARRHASGKVFLVENDEGLTGCCDRTGKMILPCKFVQVRIIEGDKLIARDKLYAINPDQIYDAQGTLLFELKDWNGDSCYGYSCGLMRISDKKTGGIGFIDATGKTVIDPGKYDTEFSFSENLCAVRIHSAESEDSAFIDTTGRLVIGPFKNSVAMPFNGGLAVIQSKKGEEIICGAVNKQGKFVLPMKFWRIGTLGNGYVYALKTKDSRAEIFDADGKLLLHLPSGFSPITNGAFDLEKEQLIPVAAQQSPANPTAQKHALAGYCNKQGNFVIKPQFEYAFPFIGNFAAVIVEKDGERRVGAIDKTGKIVIPAIHQSLVVFPEGRFVVYPAPISPAAGDLAAQWRDTRKLGFKLLNETLKKYDFIGMKFCDVQKIMGSGYSGDENTFLTTKDLPRNICKRRIYALSGVSSCGNSRQDFQLGFDKNDVVVGWNLCNSCGITNDWIFENVVWLDSESGLDTRFLVPKVHADAISKFK